MSIYNEIIEKSKGVSSSSYKEFSQKIANSKKPMLGVRIPVLRELAKEVLLSDYNSFLSDCKFEFFEDTLIYGLVIAGLEYDEFLNFLANYLNNVDSWSHIDSFVPSIKCLNSKKREFFEIVKKEILKASEFHLRFFIVVLMDYYLDEEHLDFIFSTVEKCDGKGYYNDMALAWLISVAYVKFKDKTFEFIKRCKLSNFTLNKSISKIKDSFRVSRENKILLQNYIRKN